MFEHIKRFSIVPLFMGMIFVGLSPITAWGEDLKTLVQEYFSLSQEQEDEKLAEIVNSGASIAQIQSVLKQGRVYKVKPTGPWHAIPIEVGGGLYRYALYVPEGYDPQRAYPLLVCLHGAGFSGSSYLRRWVPRLKEQYLLACPSIDEGGQWWMRDAEAMVLSVVDDVIREYHVDPNRVYLSGMSNGAVGNYAIGAHRADRFAAIAPMAGCYPYGLYPLLQNFRMTPIYLLHGTYDDIMPVTCSRDVFTELARLGVPSFYREHDRKHDAPGVGGHFFPDEELPDLLDWISRQTRNPLPKEITLLRDQDHLEQFYWVRIDAVSEGTASLWDSTVKEGEQLVLARLEAFAVSPSEIVVMTSHVDKYTLFLSPSLFDLDQPITITTNGNRSFKGKVKKDPNILLYGAKHNPGALFPSMVTITVSRHES